MLRLDVSLKIRIRAQPTKRKSFGLYRSSHSNYRVMCIELCRRFATRLRFGQNRENPRVRRSFGGQKSERLREAGERT
jgi:hypothetical protein